MKRVCALLILLGFLATTTPVVLAQDDVEDLLPEGKPMLTEVEGDPADYLRIKLPAGWGWEGGVEREEGIYYGIPAKLASGTASNQENGDLVWLIALLTESSPETSILLRSYVDEFVEWFDAQITREDFLGDESWELKWTIVYATQYGVIWRRGRVGAIVWGTSKAAAYTFADLIDDQMQPKIDWTPFMALALMGGVVVSVWAYGAKRWRVRA